jgi:hypothetical protein
LSISHSFCPFIRTGFFAHPNPNTPKPQNPKTPNIAKIK